MGEFLQAALPWVVIGVAVALVCAGRHKSKDNNYMTEGMSIGMCLGAALGASGVIDIGVGVSAGMALGLAVGMNMKK